MAERIKIPALNVTGKDDPWREEGLELFKKHFDEKTATLMEFGVGHRLPILEEDTKKITDKILKMHWDSEERRQMDLPSAVE